MGCTGGSTSLRPANARHLCSLPRLVCRCTFKKLVMPAGLLAPHTCLIRSVIGGSATALQAHTQGGQALTQGGQLALVVQRTQRVQLLQRPEHRFCGRQGQQGLGGCESGDWREAEGDSVYGCSSAWNIVSAQRGSRSMAGVEPG